MWTVVIFLICHFVIIHGVRGGIEKASKIMMPVLFILLLIIVVAACLLPNAGKGVEFLLKPDFSKVDNGVFLGALGQSFYSLSIGMGCICTYASYFSRQTNLFKTALQISVIDFMVAILAGLMIFPAAFSVGVSPDSGPSLIFITLPNVFNEAFAAVPVLGWTISLLFYVLLAFAHFSAPSHHKQSTPYNLHHEYSNKYPIPIHRKGSPSFHPHLIASWKLPDF
jgi:NSS family neurotransmitter:Na+ symporter